MFVLAGLMALAAAGIALDLTSSGQDSEGEDDLDDPAPVLAEPDSGEVGDVSSDQTEEAGAEEIDWSALEPVADDDLIEGSDLGDDLQGGAGSDTILAGAGDDWVQGDGTSEPSGRDELHGGAGDDSLAGQGGDDTAWGDEGDDTILGGDGNDTLFGGAGNDWLAGHDGDDVLVAGRGSDDLGSGRGNDLLVGNDDPQTVWLHGGEGDDTLMPGAGDFAEGQQGADRFVLKEGGGPLPVIGDFDAREDQLVLHLPQHLPSPVSIDMIQDKDGTLLVTVNGNPVARMLQGGGLTPADIVLARLPK